MAAGMSPAKKRPAAAGHGTLGLDNEGVCRAATDRVMYVRLKAAHLDGRRVITSAAILAETVRGESRDAGIYRVLSHVVVEPVTREIGDQAGKLIGAAKLTTDQAVDAMVAATALIETGPALIVTSDVPHLSALVNGYDQVNV